MSAQCESDIYQLLQLQGHVVSLTCLRAVRLSDVGQDVFVDESFAS